MTQTATDISDLRVLIGYIREVSGIALGDEKRYLLERRLGAVLRETGSPSFATLTQRARDDASGQLRWQILDAITTQETSFFRDPKTFEWVKQRWLPGLRRSGQGRFDVWSAACSTGQEPYSLAMTLMEVWPESEQPKLHIVATDLSRAALAQAEEGRYSEAEARRGLTPAHLARFFARDGSTWQATAALRERVRYRRLNLQRSWEGMGTFDLVLIRNVLIYFDLDTRRAVLNRMVDRLRPGGTLFLGATEPMPEGVALARKEELGVVFYTRPS